MQEIIVEEVLGEAQVEALVSIIQGQEFRTQLGEWAFNSKSTRHMVDLDYDNGVVNYSFDVRDLPEQILFSNYHRVSKSKGKGSESLQSLEGLLAQVARRLKKPVVIKFPLFDQASTSLWLEKNGYTALERDIYSKEIVPDNAHK